MTSINQVRYIKFYIKTEFQNQIPKFLRIYFFGTATKKREFFFSFAQKFLPERPEILCNRKEYADTKANP